MQQQSFKIEKSVNLRRACKNCGIDVLIFDTVEKWLDSNCRDLAHSIFLKQEVIGIFAQYNEGI